MKPLSEALEEYRADPFGFSRPRFKLLRPDPVPPQDDALLSQNDEIDQPEIKTDQEVSRKRRRYATAKPKRAATKRRKPQPKTEDELAAIKLDGESTRFLQRLLELHEDLLLTRHPSSYPHSFYTHVGSVSTKDMMIDHDPEEYDALDAMIDQEVLDRALEEWQEDDYPWLEDPLWRHNAPMYDGYKLTPIMSAQTKDRKLDDKHRLYEFDYDRRNGLID